MPPHSAQDQIIANPSGHVLVGACTERLWIILSLNQAKHEIKYEKKTSFMRKKRFSIMLSVLFISLYTYAQANSFYSFSI